MAYWVEVERDVVEVAGPDALTYLQGQVSQDLLPMAVGDSRWTFLLQPNGRVDVLARVWRVADERFVLDTDAGFGDEMAARLARFKIRVKAEIVPLPWRCIAVRGAELSGGVVGWWDRDGDLLGESVTPPDGVAAGTLADHERARIEAAWPAMGAEIVPGETIPAETGISAVAVDFRKGCYPGQELVERMDSRGASAPRSSRVVTVTEGAKPGDPFELDGQVVGTLTSVAGTVALASVKRGVEV